MATPLGNFYISDNHERSNGYKRLKNEETANKWMALHSKLQRGVDSREENLDMKINKIEHQDNEKTENERNLDDAQLLTHEDASKVVGKVDNECDNVWHHNEEQSFATVYRNWSLTSIKGFDDNITTVYFR